MTACLPADRVLEALVDTYRAYFDIETVDDRQLRYIATMRSMTEGYILTKKANMWSVRDEEHILIYDTRDLDADILGSIITDSLSRSKNMISPGKDHRCTVITSIVLCNRLDQTCHDRVVKYKYARSFRLMLNGWMEHHIVIIPLNGDSPTCSRHAEGHVDNAMRVLDRCIG